MLKFLKRNWDRVSRTGLRENETVLEFREIILLNRIIFVAPIVILLYLPFEIYFNGTELVHLVLLLILSFTFPLIFNYYRLFRLSKYIIFYTTLFYVGSAGLTVGNEVHNHVSFIPIVLLGIVLFKNKYEKIFSLIVVIIFYLFQKYLFEITSPIYEISPEIIAKFRVIFFILALILNFILGYYFVGINNEYEEVIHQQKDAIASKSKEILDSIQYAKRIQTAILPNDSTISNHLKNSFVLYLPKDIVAGDFYYLENVNDSIIFAAADCTGHGVPGAMVSVVCNNALNRSIREFKLSSPSQILDKTRELVVQEFEKSEVNIADGMDIALCKLNYDNLTLEFSGANNPLWIIRNGVLIEYKGSKQPIGNYYENKPFTNHLIQLEKGDTLYIFTDGFADQFGGRTKEKKGKKFKYSSLRNLFISYQDTEMSEQKDNLIETFNNWKGELEQVDDVCVIGIRL